MTDLLSPARYLDQLARRPRRYPRGAERNGLHALLERAGQPHRALRVIHIAGSKGKGSTALMLEAVLRAGGRSTGLFVSPHLQRWNERIRLDGREVDDATLARVLRALRPHVEVLHRQDGLNGPDFFEVLLVAALRLFVERGIDQVVVEAGIGARFDATAVVRPAVTAITTVEPEHVALLGPRLRNIAYDKAGIARRAVPLVLGRIPRSAREEIECVAVNVGAPVFRAAAAYHVRLARDGAHAVYRDDSGRIVFLLPVRSRVLADCAGVALACARHLPASFDLSAAAACGFAGLTLPGRLEILRRSPLVIADAAHTQASIAALCEVLRQHSAGRLTLVLSASADRDLAVLAAPLLRLAGRIIVTRADRDRSVAPAILAQRIAALGFAADLQATPDPLLALSDAFSGLSHGDTLCATGSAYMAGHARRFFAGVS